MIAILANLGQLARVSGDLIRLSGRRIFAIIDLLQGAKSILL